MGIDIYMRWPGQTEEEKSAQFTGFDITMGRVGYLREAYHGPPYATYDFVAEAFSVEHTCEEDEDSCVGCTGAPIPASVLRERLPAAQDATRERYKGAEWVDKVVQSYADFVALAEAKEAETGQPVRIEASA